MNENTAQQAPVFETILTNVVIEGEVRGKLINELSSLIDKLTGPTLSEVNKGDDLDGPLGAKEPSVIQRIDKEVKRVRDDNVRLGREIKRLHELVGA